MFNFVHHVHYVVGDRDEMVAYIGRNFGMKPVKLEVREGRAKDAYYQVSPTFIQITEPMDPNSRTGQHLAEHGPGVFHVAWGVDNIQEVARDLADKGNAVSKEFGANRDSKGYLSLNIDYQGLWFQLSEG